MGSPGGVKTIKKKTMRLHGRAHVAIATSATLSGARYLKRSADVCRARDRARASLYGRLGSLISRGHRY